MRNLGGGDKEEDDNDDRRRSPKENVQRLVDKVQTLCSSVQYWRKGTIDKPPPIWKKVPTVVDSGLYDGAFPHVGGSISVVTDDLGFSFVLDARLCTRTLALLNVDAKNNTFEATLEVVLEWEVDQTQYDVCVEFWDKFRPNLHFENALDPEPVFGPDSEPAENGCLALRDDRDGRQTILRHFEYRKRTQRKFHQPLHLEEYPFDVQTLPITFYANRTFAYGRPYHLRLRHPSARDDKDDDETDSAHHVFEENADCVDDMSTETLFALEGRETLPRLAEIPEPSSSEAKKRPRIDKYSLLLFVSRQYLSIVYNIYVPLVFMFILSFLAFFIPPCAVTDRASVSLTLLLTTVALKTYMSDKLPSVPYVTAAETFLFYIKVILLFQSIMMAAAASSCVRFGAQGQFGLDMDALEPGDDDDDDDDWNCRTDENQYDYWCANRRARVQNVLDVVAIWFSCFIGVYALVRHVLVRIFHMNNKLFEIHKFKTTSEYGFYTTEKHRPPSLDAAENARRLRQRRRKVESRLCFFAIRHAQDEGTWRILRWFLDAIEERFLWRVHCSLVAFDARIKRSSSSSSSSPFRVAPGVSSSTTTTTPPPPRGDAVERTTSTPNRRRRRWILHDWRANASPITLDDDDGGGASPSAINARLSAEYAKRRQEATTFFAKKFNERPPGYNNPRIQHGFRLPWREKPLVPKLIRQKTDELVEPTAGGRESHKVILFDCGTGETKALVASLVDEFVSRRHRQLVVLRDKVEKGKIGGVFANDDGAIEMQDYCRRGDTASCIRWMEHHVAPAYSFEISASAARAATSATESEIDLAKVFGFRPRLSEDAETRFKGKWDRQKPAARLWEVGEVVASSSTTTTQNDDDKKVELKTADGVKLVGLEEGTPLVSVNGAPYDDDAARRCVDRARHLAGRGFRNPKQFDRVEAMSALQFAIVREASGVDAYSLGDAIITSDHNAPDGVVVPGQRGVVVREQRSPDEDAVNVMYVVRWDDHPTLGETMVKQRRFRKGLHVDALREAVIKPVAEVQIGCACACEPTEHGWQPPVVVVGTGAWFRNSRGKVRVEALAMFEEIRRRHPTWKIERNTEFDEAWFEDLSVRYIHQLHNLHPPDAVLAVGNGSTQYSCIVVPDVRDRVVFKRKDEDADLPRYGVVASREWNRAKLTFEYTILSNDAPASEAAAAASSASSSSSSSSTSVPLLQFATTTTKKKKLSSVSREIPNVRAPDLVALAPSGVDPTTCKIPHLVQLGNRRGKSFFESQTYARRGLKAQLDEVCRRWECHARELMRELVRQDRICKGTPAYVACISASFHAAAFAGCPLNPEKTSAANAKALFQRALDELIDRVADMAAKQQQQQQQDAPLSDLRDVFEEVCTSYRRDFESYGRNADKARDKNTAKLYKNAASLCKSKCDGLKNGSYATTVLSNLVYQIVIIDALFDDDTELRFQRSWTVGEHQFRTTWTSGWYLNWLRHHGGVTIPI